MTLQPTTNNNYVQLNLQLHQGDDLLWCSIRSSHLTLQMRKELIALVHAANRIVTGGGHAVGRTIDIVGNDDTGIVRIGFVQGSQPTVDYKAQKNRFPC